MTAGRKALAVVVACAIAGLLWLSLDSGLLAPRAERLVSLPLLGLAAIFGASAWAGTVANRPERVPLFAGLAVGVGVYAIVRTFAW